jgi:Tol biopolymer transport system component
MAQFAPRNTWLIGILVLAAACSTPQPPDGDPTPTATMILVRDQALRPSIARDGQRVALIAFEDASFEELAGVIVHDLVAGTTVRADETSGGTASDGTFVTGTPAISGDGNRIAFVTDATNLAAATDTNRTIFVTDLVSGAIDTVRLADVDATSGCVDRPSLDETGATILFNYNQACYTSSFATSEMYLTPVVGGVAARMSGVARSGTGLLSADGAVVAFLSEDLGASDGDTNGLLDVYVRTVSSTALQRASLGHDGAEADANVFLGDISDDGRYVLMMSWATNLVANDTNGFADIFVYDRTGGSIERVSLAPDGGELNGASFNARISGDGRYVVFETRALNVAPGLTQSDNRLFVREIDTGAMARLDVPADGDPELGIRQGEFDVSGDGRFVVFVSGNALLPGAEEESLAVYRVENPLWTP